ncbi:MAG: hypothetical protein JWP87_4284 [Labilithrix sp.]|nr:hypothetical protein [Labilithrix sp.]
MTISRAETEHASRRLRDADDDLPATTRRETPRARAEREPSEPRALDESRVANHVERQPASSDYLAFLSNVSNVAAAVVVGDAARDAAVQGKLDAVRDAFSGPYVVAGQTVAARPMFRMLTHVVAQKLANEVDAVGARAGVRSPYASRVGQGTAKDLVKITQALIDAGRLPPGAPGDLAVRIRRMQWDYGIGVDCAGYSKQALIACSERTPKMRGPGMESFRDPDPDRRGDGSFSKVSLEKARPGDLITLDGPTKKDWGHNVVVYSHVTADAAKKAALAAESSALRAFLASPGPHHVIEVDSSWGAGENGAEVGGYRRDAWLYDASTKTWGSFEPGTSPRVFVTSAKGPAHDVFHGVYR